VPQADRAVLDPIWTTTYQTRDHGFLVFDTLFGVDSHYKAQPQMAEGAVSGDDGKTWRISSIRRSTIRRSVERCWVWSSSLTT
jgi:peptide/nickel transport system substrate-binding protein